MFSGLSKLADKPFIVGFLVPALFGLFCLVIPNQDLPLFASWVKKAGEGDKHLGDVVAVLFMLWASALFLMQFNIIIFKILEGYYGPFNHPYFVRKQIKRYRKIRQPYDVALAELEEVQRAIAYLEMEDMTRHFGYLEKRDLDVEENKQKLAAMRAEEDSLRQRTNKEEERWRRDYLPDERFIKGTRLGNVIRAFENYPAEVYDVSSIAVWPRIVDVISKDYLEVISEARADVDMWLSFTVVLFAVFLFEIGRVLAYLAGVAREPSILPVVVTIVASVGLGRAAYLMAVQAARSWWGETYRSAYDLYLDALAKKLGYIVPTDVEGRRRFWRSVSNQFRYMTRKDVPDFPRAPPADSSVDTSKPREGGGADAAAEAGGAEKEAGDTARPDESNSEVAGDATPDAKEKPAQGPVGDNA